MSVTLRQLEYLVALSKHNSFAKASFSCSVSQPTLSLQVRKLEQRLGLILVDRRVRGVRLTAAGKAIADQARVVLREHKSLIHIAQSNVNPLGGNLGLGLIPTIAPYLLPMVLPTIRQRLPELRLHIFENQTSTLVNNLNSGVLDAGVMALPIQDSVLDQEFLYREPFLLTVHPDHPKADRDFVTIQELKNEEVLLLDEGHCLRTQALDLCNSNNAHPNMNVRAASLETIRQMVAENMGVTLLPALATRDSHGVTHLPFRGEVPSREIALLRPRDSHRTAVIQELAQILSSCTQVPLLDYGEAMGSAR